ncbi:Similar to UTG2: UDP-glucosyltransferase 2 (Dactylopius coccus) [Cotesia congregata]|uniref:Similar to UTG2: UDP-glucosyltransferase 2 (Dactylopius coccus) n=1 Tax=Cotesia congregata TaxID=51543 RepID=A0A8J2EM00_COTCN|nr:Similar to UTG2: UDP-glucosyltransferase 2 (Dactylopius coccus) [Cotesia congregata]
MEIKYLLCLYLSFLIVLDQCHGHRILGIFPMNGKSHMVMFEQVMKGLARRGHQVDVVSTFPLEKLFPNYKDLAIKAALPKFVNNMTYDFFQDVTQKTNIVQFLAENAGNIICEKGFETDVLRNIIYKPQKPAYDLVITEDTKLISLAITFIFISSISTSYGRPYRVLGIFPLNSRSHFVFFEQLSKGLARRGHKVDVISTFPQKIACPNYTDIEIPAAIPKLVNSLTYEFAQENLNVNSDQVHFFAQIPGNVVCEKGFQNQAVLDLIEKPSGDKANGSRILGIFPMYGKSHMMFFESLFKGLARQGHQVDIVSNFPLHKPYPNYTDLEIPPLSPNLVNGMTLDFMEKSFQEINMVYYMAGDLGNKICQKGFETPVLQNLIKTQHSPAYDLVIVENYESETANFVNFDLNRV